MKKLNEAQRTVMLYKEAYRLLNNEEIIVERRGSRYLVYTKDEKSFLGSSFTSKQLKNMTNNLLERYEYRNIK